MHLFFPVNVAKYDQSDFFQHVQGAGALLHREMVSIDVACFLQIQNYWSNLSF